MLGEGEATVASGSQARSLRDRVDMAQVADAGMADDLHPFSGQGPRCSHIPIFCSHKN